MAPLRSLLPILSAFAALQSIAAEQEQKPLLNPDYVCHHPPYKVLMVSKSPLVIYITDFITPSERAHLQNITRDTFSRSAVTPRGNTKSSSSSSSSSTHHKVRTSQSTTVPRDPLVRCIEDRALAFQGLSVARAQLEPLQLVKYHPSESYHYHTDWFTDPTHAAPAVGGNRISSFFGYVYVANDTTGGGTNFPHLEAPSDGRWCEAGIVDCDEEWEKGVTFRPVEGNAIYWENMVGDGKGGMRGDERTLHAGLPVTGGGKIGVNIWTREMEMGEEVRGVDL